MDLFDAVGTWTSLRDPAVPEIAAASAVDFVVIDTEHAPLSLESVADGLRAVAARDGSAVVRPAWNDPVRIKRLLDLGPDGLLVPMVESAAAARDVVAATRYPPAGVRGVAAGRAADYGRSFGSYVRDDHDALARIVQIESAAAVDNAAEIAAVDGVDALFVGPADLSASLDVFGEWTDTAFTEAIETVLAAGEAAGVPVGTIGARPREIRALGAMGFDFLVAGVDTTHLLAGIDRAHEAAVETLDAT